MPALRVIIKQPWRNNLEIVCHPAVIEVINVVNGGNAQDRRKVRRLVQSVMETYGYSPKAADGSSGSHQSSWDFLPKYLLPAIALAGFGHWVGEFSVVIASIAYLLALAVLFRGFGAWCSTRKRIVTRRILASIVVLVFAWFDGKERMDSKLSVFGSHT